MSANVARRAVLRAMGATAMAAGGFDNAIAQAQQPAPWTSGTESPKLKAPPNACDCHMHIYDSRFPVAPNAKLRPPDATVDDYRRLRKRIGATRNVVVTASTYGADPGSVHVEPPPRETTALKRLMAGFAFRR